MENEEITEEFDYEDDEFGEADDEAGKSCEQPQPAAKKEWPQQIHPNPDMPPWERLPEESTEAYAAFCIYRDLGRKRSVLKAWRLQGGCERAAVPGRWNKWRAKHQWVKRTDFYDEEIERQHRCLGREIEMGLEKMRLMRQLHAQDAAAVFASQIMDRVRTLIPDIHLMDRNIKREDGSEVILRGTSPGQLARLIQQIRDLEAALHHGFPKSSTALW